MLNLYKGRTYKFVYTNYKGETSFRVVTFKGLSYGQSPFHGDSEHWFLRGHCLERDATRSFKLDDIMTSTLEEV